MDIIDLIEYGRWLFSLSLVKGLLTGAGAAAVVDLNAFRSWKSFDEAASYSWATARFRWLQGAILGALAGAGLGL